MRRRLAWALIAVALCCVANARAQTAARIVLVGDPDRDLTRQLLAEAKQAGFVVIADSDESAGQDAPSVAERYAAVGVLRAGAASSVELWLPGNADDAPSSITLRARPGEAGAFAVRVIEEVRARVVALHLPEPRAPAARPRAPDSERRSAVPTPSLGPNLPLLEAGAGLAATTAAGGMGTSVEAELDAHARLASRFCAAILAQFTF